VIDDITEENSAPIKDVSLTSTDVLIDNSGTMETVTGESKETANESITEDGFVEVTYLGDADRFDIAQYVFRPGVPVSVPSYIAEELLTFPFEVFEVKE
jgi:hypothetical protein